MYRSEAWTLNAEMTRRLEVSEMWMYRRMMRISFSQHMSNEEVLRQVEEDRSLNKSIRKRQLEFLGHILRKDGMENLCITGKVPEQNLTSAKLLRTARDRQKWKAMITYVLNGHCT